MGGNSIILKRVHKLYIARSIYRIICIVMFFEESVVEHTYLLTRLYYNVYISCIYGTVNIRTVQLVNNKFLSQPILCKHNIMH